MRLVGRRVELGRGLEFRNGGRIVILQFQCESEIVMELEIVGIALQAGAEDLDGFVNFVHLHVRSREILVRGRIAGPIGKRAPEKRNGIFCVSSKEESETQARNRVCVLRLSFNDLAKQGKSLTLVAGALKH